MAAEKSPSTSRGIVSKLRTIERANQRGTVMTISEYLAATALVALILWAVFGAVNAGKLAVGLSLCRGCVAQIPKCLHRFRAL